MIFREEALAYYAQAAEEGSLLQVDSDWGNYVYGFVCLGFVAVLLTAALVPLHRYATGTAIVRAAGRTEVTVTSGGTVAKVAVSAGDEVTSAQVLLELDSQVQEQELRRIVQEIMLLQARLLRNPADQSSRSGLLGLRAQRQEAEARLQARRVRAPFAGRILDVHLRRGQQLQPGDVAATIAAPNSFVVIGLLPGFARPAMTTGTALRIELDGYRHHYLEVPVRNIATEVLGPEAARRTLGLQVADSLQLEGPLALVEAELPRAGFMYDSQRYCFFDGMRAKVEVRTRSESMLLALIPGLREVVQRVRRF
jgi:membrane fusion protein (multidrug efflux system)